MYINCSEIKGTKILVERRDANAVQKVLFGCGYGFELALEKDMTLRKYNTAVCFFIDYNGYITVSEKLNGAEDEDFWADFYDSSYDEIDYSSLF